MNINELDIFAKNTFGDLRLANRGNLIIMAFVLSGTSVINRTFGSLKERMAAYRFLLNPNITKEKFISALKNQCLNNIKNMENKEHILLIQDTSEFNFKDHTKRIKRKQIIPDRYLTIIPVFFVIT